MKKSIIFVLSVILMFGLLVSCNFYDTGKAAETVFEQDNTQEIVYIDFGSVSKGLTMSEYLGMGSSNPFLSMYEETLNALTAQEFTAFDLTTLEQQNAVKNMVRFNMSGVAEQALPIIPSLKATKAKSVEAYVKNLTDDFASAETYGFKVSIDKNATCACKDGYFARYYLYTSQQKLNANDPFYQIDFYYNVKDKTFSYRGMMIITAHSEQGGDNDNIRYFQLINVPVTIESNGNGNGNGNGNDNGNGKNVSFIADEKNNDFRVDVFTLNANGSYSNLFEKYITGYQLTTWNVLSNFTNSLVATTGINPRCTEILSITADEIKDALQQIYEDDLASYYTDNGITRFVGNSYNGEPDPTQPYTGDGSDIGGLDPNLWTLDTAKVFLSACYDWEGKSNGAVFPMNKLYDSSSTINDFNNSGLKFKTGITFDKEMKGIYYPAIFSLKDQIGAILDPQDNKVVTDASGDNPFNDGMNYIYVKNFDKYFGDEYFGEGLGFDSTKGFKVFVDTLLKCCGSDLTYDSLYSSK